MARRAVVTRFGRTGAGAASGVPGWLTRASRLPPASGRLRADPTGPVARPSPGRLIFPLFNLLSLVGGTGVRRRFAFEESARVYPLERPRPLPEWTIPLVRRVVGPGRVVRMTSGVNTRKALRAADSKAAASGNTVHLHDPPRRSADSIAVLAHELSHVADRERAPRFFLDALFDEGERRARALESTVRSLATGPGVSGVTSVARDGGGLPVAAARYGEQARSGIEGAAETLRAAPAGLEPVIGRLASLGGAQSVSAVPSSPASSGLPATLGSGLPQLPENLSGLLGRAGSLPGAASSVLPALPASREGLAQAAGGLFGGAASASPLSSLGQGIEGLVPGGVSSLPVGSLGGLLGAAAERVPSLIEGSPGAARELMAGAESVAGGIREQIGGAEGAVRALGSEAAGEVGRVAEQLAPEAAAASNTLGSFIGSASTAATDSFSQMTEFMEVLEERLLAELERRGGRFGGMF
ncbi:MAG: DUF4157 domain-containing protein [Actinomycetota bacterium]|nr:DUF4157 domain-containing protein [Actinomycetota bacterium]